MEWIFVFFSVGSLGLLTAQLVDYVLESKRVRTANLPHHAFSSDVPPGEPVQSAGITAWYDKAA